MTQSTHQRTGVNKIAAKLVRGNIGIRDGIQKIIKKLHKQEKHKRDEHTEKGYIVWNSIEDVYLGDNGYPTESMWEQSITSFIYFLSEEDVDVVQALIINHGRSSVNITSRQLTIYRAVNEILDGVVIVPSVYSTMGYKEFDFVNAFKFGTIK